jgi:CheY-like chemotaxis protein
MPAAKASLLIVDDEPSMRMLLLQILAEDGYAARSATNGFSALVEICHEVPDFLISDLSMPDISGFEFLRTVRRQFPSIRIVAMSGAYSWDKTHCGALADAFFEKGASVDALLGILKSFSQPERWAQHPGAAPAPDWISSSAGRLRNADA